MHACHLANSAGIFLICMCAQETKQRIRLANRDAIEEGLRKELKESRAACGALNDALETASSQKNTERSLQERIAGEHDKMKQMHQSEIDAVQSQVASLTRELASLRAQSADQAKLSIRNKELSAAILELDAAFTKSEKKVCFDHFACNRHCIRLPSSHLFVLLPSWRRQPLL